LRVPEPASPAQQVVERLAPAKPQAFALLGPGPLFAAQAMGKPATASPARGSNRKSLEKLTHSYFGPGADEIGTNTGQFDRFRVISPKTLHKGLNRGIEIEDQAAGVSIPYHALHS